MGNRRRNYWKFQKPPASGDFSFESDNWIDVVAAVVKVVPLRGSELVAAQQIRATVTHKATGQWLEVITPDMRAIDLATGQKYEIASVLNVKNLNRRMELTVSERID